MTDANTDALRQRLVTATEAQAKLAQVLNDSLFSYAELGFQELESSTLLARTLEAHGFTVERGIAGIPTASMARWGAGRPVIALGSDIDCIPKASQKPGVARHEPLIEGAPGHGEGHNSGQPLNITAAIAVKRLMQRDRLPGTIKLWPGVAEELLGPRPTPVRERLLQGRRRRPVHPCRQQPRRLVGRRCNGTGLVSVEYTFKGESRARRLRPLARAQRPRRGRADEHRLELPPRAPAHPAALALRDHRRRRPAERRAAAGERLVLLPRARRPAHRQLREIGDSHRRGRR